MNSNISDPIFRQTPGRSALRVNLGAYRRTLAGSKYLMRGPAPFGARGRTIYGTFGDDSENTTKSRGRGSHAHHPYSKPLEQRRDKMTRYRTPERTIDTSPASSPSTAVWSSPTSSMGNDNDDDHHMSGCLCDVCKADAMFELYIDAKQFEEDGVCEA